MGVPETPTNTSPDADVALSIYDAFTLLASAFSADVGRSHLYSQWMVSKRRDFSVADDIPVNTGTEYVAGTSLTLDTSLFDEEQIYWWRVRYCDDLGQWSSFSTPTAFMFSVDTDELTFEVQTDAVDMNADLLKKLVMVEAAIKNASSVYGQVSSTYEMCGDYTVHSSKPMLPFGTCFPMRAGRLFKVSITGYVEDTTKIDYIILRYNILEGFNEGAFGLET